MADDETPWHAPGHGGAIPPRQRLPGELLFEFHVPTTCTFWRVELRDNCAYGVEAQFLDPVDVRIARTFYAQMDRTPRNGHRLGRGRTEGDRGRPMTDGFQKTDNLTWRECHA